MPRPTPRPSARSPRRSSAQGGLQAVNLKVAEHYINAFGILAKTNNTLIVPSNVADMAGSDRDGDDRREGPGEVSGQMRREISAWN